MKSALIKLSILLSCFFFTASSPSWAEDDFQYWSRYQIKAYENKHIKLQSMNELRVTQDGSDIGYWFTREQLIFKFIKKIPVGINYVFAQGRNNTKYTNEHRVEFDLMPKFPINDYLTITNRNKLEFRWLENREGVQNRFRQRWGIDIAIEKIPFIKKIYADTEYFINFDSGEFDQNRLIPAAIVLPCFDNADLRIFYMIQHVKRNNNWSSNEIVGTQLSISL